MDKVNSNLEIKFQIPTNSDIFAAQASVRRFLQIFLPKANKVQLFNDISRLILPSFLRSSELTFTNSDVCRLLIFIEIESRAMLVGHLFLEKKAGDSNET